MFFSSYVAFSMIQWMFAIWSLIPLHFLNPARTSGSSRFTVETGLENFERYFAGVWNEWNCTAVWIFFGIVLLWNCHCWVFHIYWYIECSTLTASTFNILNSSAGISSPPLALFIVMLPKAHLTSHSRMPGSRWVIKPSWLFGSWRFFGTVLLCILATSS